MHQRKWLLDFFWNNFCYGHVIISGNFGVVSRPAWTDPYIQEPWTCTILPLSSFQHEELPTPSLLCCARPYELSFLHHIQDILCYTKEDSGFKTEKNIYPMKFIIHIVTILIFLFYSVFESFFSLSLSFPWTHLSLLSNPILSLPEALHRSVAGARGQCHLLWDAGHVTLMPPPLLSLSQRH